MHRTMRTALIAAVAIAVGAAGSAGASKLLTGQAIKNGSIGLVDLSKTAKRALHGSAGPQGPQGAAGPQGPTGPAGPASLSTIVRSKDFAANGSSVASGEVRCPAGMVATGGSASPGEDLYTVTDIPSADGAGWVGEAFGPPGASMRVVVICTPGTAQVLPNGT